MDDKVRAPFLSIIQLAEREKASPRKLVMVEKVSCASSLRFTSMADLSCSLRRKMAISADSMCSLTYNTSTHIYTLHTTRFVNEIASERTPRQQPTSASLQLRYWYTMWRMY